MVDSFVSESDISMLTYDHARRDQHHVSGV